MEWRKTEGYSEGLELGTVSYSNGRTTLTLVIREEESQASIIKCDNANTDIGVVMKDAVEGLELFRKDYPYIKFISNQVHHEQELKAMYKAGLRAGYSDGRFLYEYPFEKALELMKKDSSVYTRWICDEAFKKAPK